MRFAAGAVGAVVLAACQSFGQSVTSPPADAGSEAVDAAIAADSADAAAPDAPPPFDPFTMPPAIGTGCQGRPGIAPSLCYDYESGAPTAVEGSGPLTVTAGPFGQALLASIDAQPTDAWAYYQAPIGTGLHEIVWTYDLLVPPAVPKEVELAELVTPHGGQKCVLQTHLTPASTIEFYEYCGDPNPHELLTTLPIAELPGGWVNLFIHVDFDRPTVIATLTSHIGKASDTKPTQHADGAGPLAFDIGIRFLRQNSAAVAIETDNFAAYWR